VHCITTNCACAGKKTKKNQREVCKGERDTGGPQLDAHRHCLSPQLDLDVTAGRQPACGLGAAALARDMQVAQHGCVRDVSVALVLDPFVGVDDVVHFEGQPAELGT